MEKTIRLHIGGMSCVNCQNKIEEALHHTKGIIGVKVSYGNATADIVYDGEAISLEEIIAVIERLDYETFLKEKAAGLDMTNIICMLVIIVALYVMLQSMGILNLLVPSQLADAKMGYGMLFVIGLITSVHCIAMCGGINLSQCIPQVAQGGQNDKRVAVFAPAFLYNMGRVLSYTAMGFVLGTAGFLIGGTELGLSIFLQGILKIIAGLFMVIMGINMLGLFPWLRKFTLRMPKFLVRKIGKQKAKANRPFLVGILNGFMPCGPLQSMWIVALASASPFSGALSMFLFSMGTVPLMLGFGSIVSALGKKFTDKVMTVGAVLVVVLGLAMLSQGGSLSGLLPSDLLLVLVIAFCIAGVLLSIPVRGKAVEHMIKAVSMAVVIGSYALWSFQGTLAQSSSAADTNVEVVDGVQVVESTLSSGRYPNITVRAGVPVKWVIDAPEGSINGCNNRMIIRDYGVEYSFHTGENVIEFTPESTGTVRYSCWMGMIRGNIFVTDGTEGNAAASSEVSVPTPAGYAIPTKNLAVASPSKDEYGNEIQEVSITLTDEGFSPAVVVVQREKTVYWNLENRLSDAEKGTGLLAPYYSTQLTLKNGVNQLSLYPTESFDVSTDDNRFYAYIKVVDDLTAVDEVAVREEVDAFEPLIYPAEVFESSGMSCCN